MQVHSGFRTNQSKGLWYGPLFKIWNLTGCRGTRAGGEVLETKLLQTCFFFIIFFRIMVDLNEDRESACFLFLCVCLSRKLGECMVNERFNGHLPTKTRLFNLYWGKCITGSKLQHVYLCIKETCPLSKIGTGDIHRSLSEPLHLTVFISLWDTP